MPTPPCEAFFLACGAGQRLCLLHRPAASAPARGAIVYVHPFAEEMNKSRRMAALQARAFADAGHAVLQIDLLGCGDSSGDFGDASWADWVGDVVLAATWLRARIDAPLWLWGLRVGALIAAESSALIDTSCNFVFWQPVTSGKLALQQFLRLKAAASLAGDGQAKAVLDGARAELARGEPVEVAGYALAPALADGLQHSTLGPAVRPGRVLWLELSARESPTLAPAALDSVARWRATDHDVRTQALRGPAFWQSSEIETSSALIEASLEAMERW